MQRLHPPATFAHEQQSRRPRRHPHPRRAHAQPEEHRPRPAARPPDGDHRPVGLGQVLARLRHAVRGRPAALRGIAVGLCAAVPVGDGKARRRPHRGPVAGHFHRAEIHLPQPALDGRHHHRDLRLPAPAVRPRGRAAVPGARRGAARADREPDGRRAAGAAAGHARDVAGAGGGGAQGRARAVAGWPARARLRAGAHRRHAHRARRRADAGRQAQARHRGGGGPPARAAGRAKPPRRFGGSRARARRRPAAGGVSG